MSKSSLTTYPSAKSLQEWSRWYWKVRAFKIRIISSGGTWEGLREDANPARNPTVATEVAMGWSGTFGDPVFASGATFAFGLGGSPMFSRMAGTGPEKLATDYSLNGHIVKSDGSGTVGSAHALYYNTNPSSFEMGGYLCDLILGVAGSGTESRIAIYEERFPTTDPSTVTLTSIEVFPDPDTPEWSP